MKWFAPVEWLHEWLILWRPHGPSLSRHLKALRGLSFLAYEGRRLNGNGALWRSFHFKVVGSNWVAILHDQGAERKPWVIFIERAPGTEYGGRFSNFERMISQLPSDLRLQFQEHANLFTQTSSART